MRPHQAETIPLVGSTELGRILSVSYKTIERWRHLGMPHLKLSARSYRYDLAQVHQWLADRQQAEKGAA